MLATPGTPPVDNERWAREMKWDGARALAVVRGGRCRIFSRNHRELSGSFPELVVTLCW
ncbi:hypothetical protein OG225_41075 (plasmid) [Nocardia sp. NBC_01377]|uniref:ATP-dependent DNA ligase n=1 Tax=Nocardia sp. NBC_01377 TaxID=2903595 RepID=UPI002F911CBC